MKLLTKIFVSLALCMMMLPALAQQKRTINGTVMAPDNTPLANANVVVKGSKQGVKSNADGKFSIEVDAGPQILVVSYVGMKTTELSVAADATSAALTLENDESILSEVVVTTGYQTLPKERATGAFGTVSKEQIERPSTNISTRIIGTNSGVQALRMDEEGNPFFQIRGLSTLYANQEPLLVVDGFPVQGSYNTVNPNDVESITILKDAAASSIWGSRAVNGVIVITTKRAKKGIPIKVEFNAFTRIGSKIDLDYSRPQATSAEQVDYEKLAFDKWGAQTNAGNLISNNAWTWTPGQLAMNEHKLGFLSLTQRDKILDSLKTLDNRQQISDELLANPITQQYNLSMFSSSERMNNAVSFMYEKNQSNFQETYNQRFMLNYRALANITKWLDFSLNTMIQHNKYTNNGSSLAEIQSLAPYEMLRNNDGGYAPTTLKYYLPLIARAVPTNLFPYSDWSYNPAREIKSRSQTQKDFNARVQAGIALKIMKGLNFESSIQYEYFNTFNRNLYNENSFTVRQTINQAAFWNPTLPTAMTTLPILNLPKGSMLNQNRSENVAWNFRNMLRLDRKFGSKHEVNFVAGSEQQSRVVQGFFHPTTYGYNDATLQVGAFPNGPGGNPVNGNQNGTGAATNLNIRNWLNNVTSFGYTNSFSYTTDRFFSLFSNVAYTYNDKYTLTGSARTDGANFITDDPKYRYNPFWSVGGSWQMWKENFMRNVDFVDKLSVRLTYGYNGNQDRSTSFMPLISLATLPNALTNQFTASFSSLGNPTLRWEKTGSLNFGVDYSIFKGKLFGNFNLYRRNGKDLLANIAIPAVNGSTFQFLNNAAMVNKGIEMEFGTTLKITNDLRWSGNLNFSYNKNEITDLFITQYNSFALVGRSTASYAVGYNANTLWMYKYMGFNSANQPTVLGPGGVNYDMQTFVPGDGRTYLDNVGTLVAPYTLGFMNNFDYKNFNLSFIVTGNFGHVFQRRGFNYPIQWSFAARTLANKFVGEAVNGKSSEILTLPVNPAEPRFFFWDRYYNNLSYLGQSASWLRMQEVNLTYRLPRKALTKTGLNNMQIYAQGNDLFVILSNEYGEDPLYALGTLNPRPKFTFGIKCDF